MEIAIKLIEAFMPLVIAYVQKHHVDKTNDEHDQIICDLVRKELNGYHCKMENQ